MYLVTIYDVASLDCGFKASFAGIIIGRDYGGVYMVCKCICTSVNSLVATVG